MWVVVGVGMKGSNIDLTEGFCHTVFESEIDSHPKLVTMVHIRSPPTEFEGVSVGCGEYKRGGEHRVDFGRQWCGEQSM